MAAGTAPVDDRSPGGHGDLGAALAASAGLTVLDELGRGAQTVVYRIRRDGADWAAKVLLDPGGPGGEALTSFRREAALLAWVKHPGLAGVHEVGAVGGQPYLVMDLIEGRNLADELRARPMDERTAIRLGIEVAEALAAAHRVGLVHRDVKPQNILVQPDGRARVIDFGMAVRAVGDDRAGDGRVYGTLGYCAPEQTGVLKRSVDRRADLYSLGVVLFECLTGGPPFSASEAGELIRLHGTQPAPDPRTIRPELSPMVAAIVARLLAKDPDDRYNSCDSLAADLRQLLDAPGVEFDLGAHDGMLSMDRVVPMVGRDRELAALVRAWELAQTGSGHAVVVRGTAGAGRTRLLAELADRVRADGFPVLAAACADDDVPLAPLRRAVDQWLSAVARMSATRREEAYHRLRAAATAAGPAVRRLTPALGDLLGPAPSSTDPELTDGADVVARAIAAFVAGLARATGGAAVFLDDAQRADEATLRVLRHLTARLDDTPLLVAAAYLDPSDLAGTDPAALPGASETIDLPGLGAATIRNLIATLVDPDDTELAERLAARCGPTPAGAIEYLYAVLDAGMIRPHWGRWIVDLDGLDGIALPDDVSGLILRRVDGLGPRARALLTAAAAIGIRFTPATAAAASRIDPAQATDILCQAAGRRVLEDRDGEFAFVHDGIRAKLLDDLDPDAQRGLHQRIADALESGPADPGRVYAVARHLLRGETGRNRRRLFDACVAAGRLALADQAGGNAVEFLEQAATLARDPAIPAAGRPAGEVGELLGAAYRLSGRLGDAVRTLEAALETTPEQLGRVRILTQLVRLHDTRYDIDAALRTAQRAFAELGRPLPRNPLMLALTTLGMSLAATFVERTGMGFGTASGPSRERYRLEAELYAVASHASALNLDWPMLGMMSLRAVYPANRVGLGPEFSRIQFGKGVALHGIGFHRYRYSLRLARAEAERLGDPTLTAYLAWYQVILSYLNGTADDHTAGAELAPHERHLDPGLYANTVVLIGGSLLHRGYAREAHALYESARARMAASDVSGHTVSLVAIVASAALGRMTDAEARLREAQQNPMYDVLGSKVDLLTAAARVAVEQRDTGPDFDRVVDDFAALKLPYKSLPVAHRAIYTYQSYGRLEQCRVATPQRREAALAAAQAAVTLLGSAAGSGDCMKAHHQVCRAALCHLAGDHDGALDLLADLDRSLHRADAPLAAYEAARLRAAALAATGHPADAETAATAALSIAQRNGWPHRAEWIRGEFGVGPGSRMTVARLSMGPVTSTYGTMAGDSGSFNPFQHRLAALERISVAASRIIDPAELTRVSLDETIRVLGAERAFLFLAEGEPARLVPYLGRDETGADLTALTAYGSTLVERVRQSREPIVVTGTDDGADLGSQSIVAHGLRSIMVAPVQLDTRLLGVVYLDSRVAKGMFSESDAGLLMAITKHIASALETARAAQLAVAVESAQRQRDIAETMRSALTELTATLDPDEVLGRLAATLVRVLAADDHRLAVHDGDKIVIRDASGTWPVGGTDTDLDRLLGAQAPVTGGGDAPSAALATGGQVGSWVAVPLGARGGTPVGLVLLTSGRPDAFGDTECEIASALAGQGMAAYDNALLFAEVQRLATTDSLTGLLNRRQLFTLARRELELARRRATPLAAAMIDIDHFKRINDQHGHQIGDQVIRAVADRIRRATRATELIGRYGGEEFALILPDISDQPDVVGERIRASIADPPIQTDAGPLHVTASVGMTMFDPADGTADTDSLLADADRALYAAKEAGRDRVAVQPATA